MAEARLRGKWDAARERQGEVMVRELSNGSSDGEWREMVRGWLGGAAGRGGGGAVPSVGMRREADGDAEAQVEAVKVEAEAE